MGVFGEFPGSSPKGIRSCYKAQKCTKNMPKINETPKIKALPLKFSGYIPAIE